MSGPVAVSFVVVVLVVGGLLAYALYQWGQRIAISKRSTAEVTASGEYRRLSELAVTAQEHTDLKLAEINMAGPDPRPARSGAETARPATRCGCPLPSCSPGTTRARPPPPAWPLPATARSATRCGCPLPSCSPSTAPARRPPGPARVTGRTAQSVTAVMVLTHEPLRLAVWRNRSAGSRTDPG